MSDLRTLRLNAGFGMREFANRIGIPPGCYCDIEQGRNPATEEQQGIICRALGVSELPPIAPRKDDGPWIPVFVKTVSGEPLTDAQVVALYEDMNKRQD